MKLQRHVIVTILLTIYALFMCVYFGQELLRTGQYLRFFITAGVEIIVIVLTFFALRRRDRIRKRRNDKKI